MPEEVPLAVPDWDLSPITFNPYVPPLSGGFRKMPVGEIACDRERHCDRHGGHVLTLKGREITCTSCHATWRDEGF